MQLRELVRRVQHALNASGAANPPLDESGEYSPRMASLLDNFEIELILKLKPLPEPLPAPWLDEAKKHAGESENDSKFNRWLSAFWAIVGLPHFKTIVGSSFAWCGLFCAAMLYQSGMPWQKDGAASINWDTYGQAIDWKSAGIPRGAIVRINHAGNCSSSEGNHVAMSDGDCAPWDLSEGMINLFGGNQADQVKLSAFSVAHICAVRWPPNIPKPGTVLESKGCKAPAIKESTR